MFIKVLTTLLVLFQLPAFCFCLKGKIINNGKPLAFASISIEGGVGTSCDANGKFSLCELSGDYVLVVTALGYKTEKRKVSINSDINNFALELEELDNTLNEVVITGTLQEIKRSESPIPVDVISAKFFRRNPSASLFEGMNMVNGVQPQVNCNVCSTGDIHINGMEGPYTLVTIDGMPIVSSLSTVYGLMGIPAGLLQRVEVVKGPASTLYGSEAVAGVINIITKDPKESPRFSFETFATTQKELNADIGLSTKVGRQHSLLGINLYSFQNPLDLNKDNFTDITQQERISVFNKWSLATKKRHIGSLAVRYLYEDRWGGELQWNPLFRAGDSVYGESIYTQRIELIGQVDVRADKRLNLQYSYNYHDQNSAYGKTLFLAQQHVAFSQLLWNRTFSKHNLLAGLPLKLTVYDDNTVATQEIAAGSYVINNVQYTFIPGVFLQDDWTIHPRFSLLTGARLDYSFEHGSIFSPRTALKFKAAKNTTLRLSAGNGYRVVNVFTEDHAALTGARKVLVKDDLKPERSWNICANAQQYFTIPDGFINIDASAFYTYFINKINADLLADNDYIFYDNLRGYAITKGVSANVEASFLSGVKVLVGGTVLSAYRVEKDSVGQNRKTEQLQTPAFRGNFSLSYKWKSITFDYNGYVVSPMILPVLANDFRPSKSPWYSIQNLQVSYLLKRLNLECFAGVKNFLDFVPKNPLMRPFDPFDKTAGDLVSNPNGYTFDTSYNYAPLQGRRFFVGLRYTLW